MGLDPSLAERGNKTTKFRKPPSNKHYHEGPYSTIFLRSVLEFIFRHIVLHSGTILQQKTNKLINLKKKVSFASK